MARAILDQEKVDELAGYVLKYLAMSEDDTRPGFIRNCAMTMAEHYMEQLEDLAGKEFARQVIEEVP